MTFGGREIVILVLIVAIPVGAWWTVFRPQNDHNNQMRREIEAKQEKLKALNHAMGTIGDLKKEITELTAAVKFFESKLPNEKEIDKVLQEVWHLAEANELKTRSIRTLKPRSTQTTRRHREQPIAVQLTGNYMGLYTFLQALENQPRIMKIRTMTLTKLEKAPEGHVQADFVMSVFFEPADRGTL